MYFNFLLDLLHELGFETSDKPGGCQVGELGVPIELLGLNYTITENSLKVEVPHDKLCALRKQIDKLIEYA